MPRDNAGIPRKLSQHIFKHRPSDCADFEGFNGFSDDFTTGMKRIAMQVAPMSKVGLHPVARI
jgi:hypothetical protein